MERDCNIIESVLRLNKEQTRDFILACVKHAYFGRSANLIATSMAVTVANRKDRIGAHNRAYGSERHWQATLLDKMLSTEKGEPNESDNSDNSTTGNDGQL